MASAGELVYLWGGHGNTNFAQVFIYSCKTKTWTREDSIGSPHERVNGGFTISGQRLYLYGGIECGSSRNGELHELDIKNWRWRKLTSAGGPGKKSGCRMISYQDQLLVVGGVYNKTPIPREQQDGASYEDGLTNEVHSYNLTTGMYY